MGPISSRARAVMTSVTSPTSTKETNRPDLSSSSLFPPQSMENTAPLPMHRPRITEVRNVISVKAEPTAARASAPSTRPTMRVSATL